jgi:hypothetical protein
MPVDRPGLGIRGLIARNLGIYNLTEQGILNKHDLALVVSKSLRLQINRLNRQ